MDNIYANICPKPSDNRSNIQRSGKQGTAVYTNNDVICTHSTATPTTAGTAGNSDTAPSSKAVRWLVLLCVLLLVVIAGLLGFHFTREESDCNAELAQVKVSYANLTDERDHWKGAYTNLTDATDLLKAAYTNLSNDRDQLLDAHNILKTRHDKLKLQLCHVNGALMFGNSCYYISTEKKDWETSRQDCQERGADLVIINGPEEQEFVVSLKKRVWIGLTDRDEEDVWKWVDGTPLIKSFWYTQPDDFGGGEDCAENVDFHPDLLRQWNDISCSHANLFICEINL